jgi:hypothetical protein
MPDHWGFVAAAYGLAALLLGAHWRWLCRRERELDRLASSEARGAVPVARGPQAGARGGGETGATAR